MGTVLVRTDPGCEEACAQEVREVLGVTPEIGEVLSFAGSTEDACRFAYHSKTALRVFVQLAAPADSPDQLTEIDVSLIPKGSFKVEGVVLGEGMTQELIEAVGGLLHTELERKVDLSNPDVTIFAVQGKRTYVGVDVLGDLSRREWRIMLSRRSLRATIAAAAVLYAGAQPEHAVLDPFGDDGTVGIEAALALSRTSTQLFRKNPPVLVKNWESWKKAQDMTRDVAGVTVHCGTLKETRAVRTNSKLAGVDKLIKSTKIPIEWTMAKLPEASVDRIITHVPQSGRALPERKVRALLDGLFEAAAHVLSADGSMTCVTAKPEELLKSNKCFTAKRRDVLMGKQPMSIMTFTR